MLELVASLVAGDQMGSLARQVLLDLLDPKDREDQQYDGSHSALS